jgi:hypothetical protein
MAPDKTAQFIPAELRLCAGVSGYRLAFATPASFDRIKGFPTASSAMAARSAAKQAMADLNRIFAKGN